MTERLPSIVLWLHAGLFLVLGVVSVLDIDGLLAAADISLPTANARIEARTLYGGLELGVGAFLVLCWRRDQVPLGLWLCLLAYLGLALVRGGGMLAAGATDAPLPTLLGIELLGAALAAAGLYLSARARRSSPERAT